MLVPNSRDRQGKLASKETKNGSENNLTITFPSNTSHKSLSTEHHESIQTTKLSFRIR